ncbi:MAG TPA: patatin-like phospholipase family protein [Caulobacterales bacterium]|nr:patatin-like phospholipase family protein [Caulobacterales bacterium]
MGEDNGKVEERLAAPGPKRVLSLDGGGVRGILSAGILAAVEARLIRFSGNPNFRLCDYFDLIGGTSTGSIVAAGLALGMSAAEVADLYRQMAPEVFAEQGRNAGIRKPRFDARRLEAVLARELGEVELGSAALRTGLAIFTKRIDTGSSWTLTNNPRSKYWNALNGGVPNKNLLVRKLVQASAAAPTFFEECRMVLNAPGGGVDAEGVFVDGAIAGLNNPSLQLLHVATLKGYGFEWLSGPDSLLMLSIGTGYWRPKLDQELFASTSLDELAPTAARAVEALKTMIHDTSQMAIATLQGLGQTARPWPINSELEDMRGAALSPVPLLHFQRMDARLDKVSLLDLQLGYEEQDLRLMRDLASDDAATLARLHEIGLRTGEAYFAQEPNAPRRNWERAIFPRRFDPAEFSNRALGPPKSKLEALGRAWDEKS